MTIQELYQAIEGDYNRAIAILRMDKLIDKHIRKLPQNGVVDSLLEAGETMDETLLFETSHAVKGVCGNLGLVKLADGASEITEEFRPGGNRQFSDDEIKEKLQNIAALYEKTREGIRRYEEESGK